MFRFSSIEEYHAALREGTASCLQTVQHYLEAIRNNSHLNAFIEVFEEEALRRAAWLDSQGTGGRLFGVIAGIKDNICYKGHRCSAGSAMLQDYIAPYSATAVERLLEEGSIIIGRQNCDEFGMGSHNKNSVYGPVANPADTSRVAGGSSGGSAAAVAAGLCMISLGSDTGGSVRLPADHCGIVGLKPGYGRVSRHGLVAYASSFDQIGILAQTVKDAALVLDVISGPDDFDSTALQKKEQLLFEEAPERKYRIGYFPSWVSHPSVDPEISGAIISRLQELEKQGHEVRPLEFEWTDYLIPAYYVLTTAEASSNLARYDGIRYGFREDRPNQDPAGFLSYNRTRAFGKEVKRRIMLGTFVLCSGYYDAYYTQAQKIRRLVQQKTQLIFKDLDFIASPTTTQIPPFINAGEADPTAAYMSDIFTVFASLAGIPAVSLPLFKHSSNLYFGLQLAAAGQNEVSLQRFSHQLMQQ